MQMIAFLRRAKARADGLARDVGGAILVEMAFAMPLLIGIGFAGMEIANLTLTTTRVSQMGLSAADNASRIAFGSSLALPGVREIDVNNVFTGLQEQGRGMDFENKGRIILSSLERNKDGGQWIHWQRCFGKLKFNSTYGEAGTGISGTSFPGMGPGGAEVTASTGTAVMFVEIVYKYEPLLYGQWLGEKTLRSTAAFNIREGRDLSQVYNPSPSVTPSACT
jgi:hypothetical protein